MVTSGASRQLNAARQRCLALARQQTLARNVNGGERRRACCIHRQAGTAQIVKVGDAVGGNAGRNAAVGVQVDIRPVLRVKVDIAVIVGGNADEDAGARSGQRGRRDPRILAGFLNEFEQQALLRIDVEGFARGNAEELRIEKVDPFEGTLP